MPQIFAAGHSEADGHVGDRILAVAILIYQFVMIVRGRRAAHILTGIWMLGVVYLVAVWAHLDLLRSVLAALAPYTAIALIVMFQSEIRRLLSRIGRSRWLGWEANWNAAKWPTKLCWPCSNMIEGRPAR